MVLCNAQDTTLMPFPLFNAMGYSLAVNYPDPIPIIKALRAKGLRNTHFHYSTV